MAVPKKRTSISKKRIRKIFWKNKGYWAAFKAFSLGKSLSTRNFKSFLCNKKIIKDSKNLSCFDSKRSKSILFLINYKLFINFRSFLELIRKIHIL